ncbi:hypothetical protein [Cerasicoccus frondis]|uniref:hypothetical protein n=1 Tax=Cerasicoccus frondis TaxID=490090 RepID=UPI002852D0F9|nr:hypothetical protein [Cerasicoccus frondis]
MRRKIKLICNQSVGRTFADQTSNILNLIDEIDLRTSLFLHHHEKRAIDAMSGYSDSANRLFSELDFRLDLIDFIKKELMKSRTDHFVSRSYDPYGNSKNHFRELIDQHRNIRSEIMKEAICNANNLDILDRDTALDLLGMWRRYSDELADKNWPNYNHKSIDNRIDLVSVRHNSPLTIVLDVSGVLGALIGLIWLGSYTYFYVRHSHYDLKNKIISTEVGQELLAILREKDIDLTPELLKRLIDNANIKQADLPKIKDIIIDREND